MKKLEKQEEKSTKIEDKVLNVLKLIQLNIEDIDDIKISFEYNELVIECSTPYFNRLELSFKIKINLEYINLNNSTENIPVEIGKLIIKYVEKIKRLKRNVF